MRDYSERLRHALPRRSHSVRARRMVAGHVAIEWRGISGGEGRICGHLGMLD